MSYQALSQTIMCAGDLRSLVDSTPALFVTAAQELPFGIDADHVIMNASRPLYGNEEAWGRFLAGRHFVRIDLGDERAAWMIEQNRALDGYMVIVLSRSELIEMALEGHPYRDTVLAEYPNEEDKWQVLSCRIDDFLRRPHGELAALRDSASFRLKQPR